MQHLIYNNTGDVLTIAKEDMVKLQQALSEKKKTSTPNDMDIEVIDPVAPSQLNTNTTLNSIRSISAGAIENLETPVWKLSQHQKRNASDAVIKHAIWTQIVALQNVDDIDEQLDTTNFQDLWSKPTTEEFSRDTFVSTIKAFISALLKKMEDWTKSADARYVFHRIFVTLSRTSSEIFSCDWKRTGELQPSPTASCWTAAIEVLGCSFNLKVQIKLTAKAILKSDSKGLKVVGKTLTFNIVGKSIKTKTGRFILGKIKRQPFAKKICVAKKFSIKYQSYLQLQVSGNIFGVKKWEDFVKESCHTKDAPLRTNHQH